MSNKRKAKRIAIRVPPIRPIRRVPPGISRILRKLENESNCSRAHFSSLISRTSAAVQYVKGPYHGTPLGLSFKIHYLRAFIVTRPGYQAIRGFTPRRIITGQPKISAIADIHAAGGRIRIWVWIRRSRGILR